ncbi:MAG: DMT family transporter [Pseudomonadota bacterium]
MSDLTPSDPMRAAFWMVGAMLSFSLMAVAGRELAGQHDTFEIMLYRSLIGLVVVVVIARASGTLDQVRTQRFGLHVARNAFHFAGQNLWFFAVGFIPLSQLFAFEFSTPLWGALFAPLVIGERWTRTRLLACGLGFVGILIVARPDSVSLSWPTLAAATCALGFAGAFLLTKRLSRTESITCILFWLTVIQAVFGVVFVFWDGTITWPSAATAPWVVAVGLCGLLAHFSITKALKLAPATMVMPLDFMRLPLIATVGFLLYGEPLLLSVFAGSAIIFYANWLNVRAEQRAAS